MQQQHESDAEEEFLLSGTISQIDYPSNDISGNYVTIHFNSKPRFINVTNETLVDGSSYLLSNVSDIQKFIAIGNSANTYILEIDDNGLLAKKDFYTIDDMKDIKFDDQRSETLRKRDFIYNFLSSMRQRVNDPLGVRKKKREKGN